MGRRKVVDWRRSQKKRGQRRQKNENKRNRRRKREKKGGEREEGQCKWFRSTGFQIKDVDAERES